MKFTLSILFLVMFNLAYGQVGIINLNELIIADNFKYFELRNTSNQEYDPSDLWIFNNGEAKAMNTVSALCAFPGSDRVIDANDQQAFSINGISNEGGEFVLAKSETIEGPDDIIDYVIWGDGIPNYEEFAEQAGLWIMGERASAFFTPGSLEYDGDGNSAQDWYAQAKPSACDENGSGCNVFEPNVGVNQNYYCNCITDYLNLSVSYNGSTQSSIGLLIDQNDTIRYISTMNGLGEFDEMVCFESDLSYVLLGWNGQQSGLEVGNSIDQIEGCYVFSEIIELENFNLEEYEFELTINGVAVVADEPFEICTYDDIIDDIYIFSSDTTVNIVNFVYDNTSLIVAQTEGINSPLDVSSLAPGSYKIISYSYVGVLEDSNGYYYSDPNIEGCWTVNSPEFQIEILDPATSDCTSNTEELYDLSGHINTHVSNTTLHINIEDMSYANIQYKIRDISGHELVAGKMQSDSKLLDLSQFNVGIYMISFHTSQGSYTQRFFMSN